MTKTNILIFLFLASFTVIVAQTKKPPVKNGVPNLSKDTTSYCVSNTMYGWENWYSVLETIKTQLKKTDLPAREVNYLNDSLITKMQQQILTQVRQQMKPDSITTKK